MDDHLLRVKPWTEKRKPKKILAIRFQAMGDMMITLPYLQSLKDQLPDAAVHLLCRKEVSDIPKNLTLFKKTIALGGGRNARIQFLLALLVVPYLWWQRYDVVIDLQNHRISRIIRKLLRAQAWSEFDRSSKIPAGERTRLAIDALQIEKVNLEVSLTVIHNETSGQLLKASGWVLGNHLIILNPAGAFASRNWPLENYISFANLWLARHPSAQFLVLGLRSMQSKSIRLSAALGAKLIDLSGATSALDAFSIVRHATLMVTEDSGLMHMSWIQGVPTLALFGSSPSYWSAPLGERSKCLNSADLPCGDCFLKECKFGDVHCLTRLTPALVVDEAEKLLTRKPV
jgi:heptosyltransferase II